MFHNVYAGKRVFVTGHTGFKGSWLVTWLMQLGAEVAGYSIDVPTQPSIHEALRLAQRFKDYRGDIRDRHALAMAIDEFKPDIVFHLAAQALVRLSYNDPAATFEVNTIGTLNVLEVLRHRPWISAAVLITSDKCYQNVEWVWGYREDDKLGGEDPYSGSKGAAELVAYSYMQSYFSGQVGTRVATARAGNVIGGGDWAADRIVPDCMRSWANNETVVLRNPRATRPWQHVLEPLSGYLWLGARLSVGDDDVRSQSYNFGPQPSVNHDVGMLVSRLSELWEGSKWRYDDSAQRGRPEATLLKLSCDKALAHLHWTSTLSFAETVEFTCHWYTLFYSQPQDGMFAFTLQQIQNYCEKAVAAGLAWTNQH